MLASVARREKNGVKQFQKSPQNSYGSDLGEETFDLGKLYLLKKYM